MTQVDDRRLTALKTVAFYEAVKYVDDDDDAYDVAQDTVLKLLTARDEIEKPSQWCRRTARNLCFNRLRNRATRRRILDAHEDLLEPRSPPSPEASLLLEELLPLVKPRAFKAFWHSVIDGMTHREIAQRLGVSERTVRYDIEELRRRCREAVGEEKV